MTLGFTGERIVPGALDCEPTFAQKMYQEHVARYAFAAQFAPGADVLDVGCGVGYGSQWLGKAGAKSVLGFDISAEAIEHAQMNYFHPAVSFKVQDVTALKPDNGYDLVTCFELIEHIEKQEKALDLIKATLRKDGILAISTPRPLSDIRTHFHVHEMSFEELYGMLKERFRHVDAYFEKNCFTSLIGRDLPEEIDKIVGISGNIEMEQADYFIFLASDEEIVSRVQIGSLLTINDDSYVLTLEKDVEVLRRAENDHKARIADLEKEKQDIAAAHTEVVQRSSSLSAIHQETGAIRAAMDQISNQVANEVARLSEAEGLRTRIAQLESELAEAVQPSRVLELDAALRSRMEEVESVRNALFEAQHRVARLEHELAEAMQPSRVDELEAALRSRAEELESVRNALFEAQHLHATTQSESFQIIAAKTAECEALQRQLAESQLLTRELEVARRAIAERSEQLAAAQTEAFTLRADAARLPDALERASAVENELNAVRYRLDNAEATLARFRGSFSWTITRPLRWVWRNYRKLTGRSLP